MVQNSRSPLLYTPIYIVHLFSSQVAKQTERTTPTQAGSGCRQWNSRLQFAQPGLIKVEKNLLDFSPEVIPGRVETGAGRTPKILAGQCL